VIAAHAPKRSSLLYDSLMQGHPGMRLDHNRGDQTMQL